MLEVPRRGSGGPRSFWNLLDLVQHKLAKLPGYWNLLLAVFLCLDCLCVTSLSVSCRGENCLYILVSAPPWQGQGLSV